MRRKITRKRRHNEQKGMALVLTLMAVSFLVAITVQLTSSVNWQMQGAGNLRDSVKLDAINRSGLSLVRAALQADFMENKYDSPHDSWNGLSDISSLFEKGKLRRFQVEDLSGLLQINALVPDEKDSAKFKQLQEHQIRLWKRLLNSGEFAVDDAAQVDQIIDAIIDWLDKDDNERDNGAESGYYLSRSPSYEPANAPMSYREELLLIRGMTKELFYGNDENLPLEKYVTVVGTDGLININSAPAELLMALEENNNMSRETANDLIEFRKDEDNKMALANPQWYKKVNSAIELDKALAIVQSQNFKVSVTAEYKDMTRTSTGILHRDKDKGEQTLLSWEVR